MAKVTKEGPTYTNSGLTDVIVLAHNRNFYHSRNNHDIDTVTIHCMVGQLSVETCGQIFQDGTRGASSNYGVGSDGRIGLYVGENYGAYCSCNAANDKRAITIEVASGTVNPYEVNDAAYESLIKLLIDICQRYDIKELKWQGDPSLIGQIDKQNMTVHRWFSSKECPGQWLYERHGKIAAEVNSKLKTTAKIPPLDREIPFEEYPSDENMPKEPEDVSGRKKKQVVDDEEDETTQTVTQINYVTSPNSSLVEYKNRVAAETSTNRSGAIDGITVHIAKKIGYMEDLALMVNSSPTTYNYGIDTYGTIGLFADEPVKTNATGNAKNDDRCINIVCMNNKASSDWPISEATYDALVALCSDICRRNYIEAFTYTNKPAKDSLTLHSQFNSEANCPGQYFMKNIKQFVRDVNVRLSQDWAKANARIATTNAAALYIQSGINMDSIMPYVAFPDKDQININYSSIRDTGVVGIMLDAGMRLDSKHEKVTYRNPNLYTQVKEVEEAKLPYGFVYTTHAASIDDVKEETYWLYFIIAKYPPKLGIWLRPDLKVSTSVAQAIVEKYYSTFVDWGLKSKCGVYATKAQSVLIGWPKQCTYMPLWLAGQMTDSVCPDDELLTPSFFKLGDLTNKGYKEGQEVYDPYPKTSVQEQPSDSGDSSSSSKKKKKKTDEEAEESNENPNDDNNPNTGKVIKEVHDTYTLMTIPQPPNYRGTKKFENYTAITSKNSDQYKLVNDPEAYTDENGFRRIKGLYMIAVGFGICWTIGTYIDVILENGTVIHCIMGDAKSTQHTDPDTDNVFTSVNSNWCCSEFLVKQSLLPARVNNAGDCSKLIPAWNSKVVQFKVFNQCWPIH